MVDGVKGDEDDAVFLTLLDTLTDQRERVTAFITAEERDDGWLDHDCKRGKLRFG